MNLAQMRIEVRRALYEETADFFSDAMINSWLNEGAMLLNKIAKAEQGIFSFSPALVPGSSSDYATEFAMPGDMNEIFSVYYAGSGSGNPTELVYRDFKVAHSSPRATGQPGIFYTRKVSTKEIQRTGSGISILDIIENSNEARLVLGVYPTPTDTSATIFVHHYPRHFQMDSDEDVPHVPAEFRRGIIHYAAHLGFEKEAARDDSAYHLKRYNEYAAELKAEQIYEGQQSSFPRVSVHGEDEDIVPRTFVSYLE